MTTTKDARVIRTLDVLLSTVALICLAPLLAPVMVLLRFTGEGEVFYLQERIGKGGEPFHVIKFATMLKESPNLPGGYLTRRDDPRVLPVGKVLRKLKINELPQLLNVWRGEMSFVGPRPQAPVHHALYTAEQRAVIESVKPGVTGLSALVFRDEEELLERVGEKYEWLHDHLITPYKGELEVWYASNRSLALYGKIIGLTAVSIVRPGIDSLRYFPEAPAPGPEVRAFLDGTLPSVPAEAPQGA